MESPLLKVIKSSDIFIKLGESDWIGLKQPKGLDNSPEEGKAAQVLTKES